MEDGNLGPLVDPPRRPFGHPTLPHVLRLKLVHNLAYVFLFLLIENF